VVEGIEIPSLKLLEDGTKLIRNGHGIRQINFFGLNIKIYVAHLYSLKPVVDEKQIFQRHHENDENTAKNNTTDNPHPHHHQQQKDHNPLHFDFTFLRHVGRDKVEAAWSQQTDWSVTHKYGTYDSDRRRFIQSLSSREIKNGGTQTVQLVGDSTILIDQGQYTGTIHGTDFQRSFLSMWFGPKAVANDLKEDLLQGHDHHHGRGENCNKQ
jgi:hypothetical protein